MIPHGVWKFPFQCITNFTSQLVFDSWNSIKENCNIFIHSSYLILSTTNHSKLKTKLLLYDWCFGSLRNTQSTRNYVLQPSFVTFLESIIAQNSNSNLKNLFSKFHLYLVLVCNCDTQVHCNLFYIINLVNY